MLGIGGLVVLGGFGGAAGGFLAGTWFGVLTTLLVLGIAAAVVAFAWVEIRISPEGLLARSVVLRVRLTRVSAEEVAEVWTEDFRPMSWGGWGLRFSGGDRALSITGRRAAVIRETTGRRTLIAVSQAEQVAAGLQEILQPGHAR